jgi:hypothetical protein
MRAAVSDSLEHRARLMNMVETWGGSTPEAAERAARAEAERVSLVSIHDGLVETARNDARPGLQHLALLAVLGLLGLVLIALAIGVATGAIR